MDYRETGLPLHPTLYKAYITYNQNLDNMAPSYRDGIVLRMAQRLYETGTTDPNILSAMLLSVMPRTLHGVIEKQFSKDIRDTVTEVQKHGKLRYAYIDQADDATQLICAASTLESLLRSKDAMQKTLSALEDGIAPEGAPEGRLHIPFIPSTRAFEKLFEPLANSSNQRLAQDYLDAVEDFTHFNRNYINTLINMGVIDVATAIENMLLPETRPLFDQTDIVPHDKIREAYGFVAGDPRVTDVGFNLAKQTAEILSQTRQASPATIAIALIDVALPTKLRDELPFMEKLFEWDVMEILKSHTVHAGTHPINENTPNEFLQILMAYSTATLQAARLDSQELVADIKKNDPQFKDPVLRQIVDENRALLGQAWVSVKANIEKVAALAAAPELEEIFQNELAQTKRFLDTGFPATQFKKDGPGPATDGPKVS